jgi:hypothetical protein
MKRFLKLLGALAIMFVGGTLVIYLGDLTTPAFHPAAGFWNSLWEIAGFLTPFSLGFVAILVVHFCTIGFSPYNRLMGALLCLNSAYLLWRMFTRGLAPHQSMLFHAIYNILGLLIGLKGIFSESNESTPKRDAAYEG